MALSTGWVCIPADALTVGDTVELSVTTASTMTTGPLASYSHYGRVVHTKEGALARGYELREVALLAERAQKCSDAKLTRIAERSRDPVKREVARAEMLARIEARKPKPLPTLDDWDMLEDAPAEGGIVVRP